MALSVILSPCVHSEKSVMKLLWLLGRADGFVIFNLSFFLFTWSSDVPAPIWCLACLAWRLVMAAELIKVAQLCWLQGGNGWNILLGQKRWNVRLLSPCAPLWWEHRLGDWLLQLCLAVKGPLPLSGGGAEKISEDHLNCWSTGFILGLGL